MHLGKSGYALVVALAAVLAGGSACAEAFTATNVVVAPLTDAHWTQGAPYNAYSPRGIVVFTNGWEAGCVAVAAAQELYYWQWPWRLDAVHETSHPVLNEGNLALRFDGNVPFDWESMQDSYGDGATLKQKHAVAHLVLACQSLVQMKFVSGGGEASKNLPGTMEWFEYAGSVTPRESDANLAALRADMEFGSPVQTGINFKGYGGHEVVGLGYATGTNSVGDAKNLIWLNLGWGGGSDGWYDIGETSSSETIIKSTQLGFRPVKSVQIEPLAPVSWYSATVNWHLPNCYTNKISGFVAETKKLSPSRKTWSDDFSTGGKGRSSNTNEMRVANGGLMAWDGTASAVYTWDEKFVPTEDSMLTYDIGSAYMSGMSARIEAKFGNGSWETIHHFGLDGGKGDGSYYNWGTMTTGLSVSLAKYAGKVAQLRIVVEYTNGGVYNNSDANMKIDNISVSNVNMFVTVARDGSIAASARSATFGDLEYGETYAFSVAPTMSDGSASVTQTVTTVIGNPATAPTIDAVAMSPRGTDLVQEGFYADIAMGPNAIDVTCPSSVKSLEAFPSHPSVLPQDKVEVVNSGSGKFAVLVDASEVAAKWAGQRLVLTLKATNADGAAAYKDLELCLKSSGVPVGFPDANIWTAASSDWYAEPVSGSWSKGRAPNASDQYVVFNRSGNTDVYIEDNVSLDTVAVEGSGSFKFVDAFNSGVRVSIETLMTEASFTIDGAIDSVGEVRRLTALSSEDLIVSSGKSVTIAGGKSWTVGGGVHFGGSQTITVNGALNGAIAADGTGTVLSLAPTATVTAASLSFAGNTIRLAMTAEASPTFSVTGAANLTSATIEVALADGMSAGDSIALMSAGSFEGVDTATLEGLDGYSLEVSGGTLYATKDIPPTPATSLEESEGFVTSESQLAFKDATLAMLTSEALGGKFGGAWAGTADGAEVVFNNFDRTAEASGTITCQAQVANDGYVKGVLLTFTQSGGNVYVFMTGAKYIQGASLGDSIAGGSDASQGGEWKYAVSALSLKYLGPAPMAVWVAGEFDDDRSAHGGLEISLNGNTTNALGQIVIGNSTTLGATISLPAETHQKVTMLVKYSIAPGGAPAANSVPASMFSTYDLGALAAQGSSALDGYWLNGSTVTTGYAFSNTAPTILEEGYILISTYANKDGAHGTAVYTGETIVTLAGGEKSGLRFTGDDHFITSVGIGGPTVAGAVPWTGMVIKSVAIFDEWFTPTDLATYRFPGQGAVLPEDSDLYVIEPVAKWVNDFKTTEKNGCTLSVSGTTAAKDDSFGGILTVGDAAAVIDVSSTTNGGSVTVLVKYRAASDSVNAPVVTFGETLSNNVRIDVGAYTTNAWTLAVNRSWNGGNNKWVALNTAASLNEGEGYLLCARKSNDMLVYVGDSLANMTGGSTAAPGDITFTCNLIQAIGIGGSSGLPNADSTWSAFDGFVVEKVVVFNGYYTPDQIRYVAIPEDSDTLSIADGKTWNFAAGTTRTYTNIGTLSASGTIAVTNASELSEGSYMLATWTTPQKLISSYGHVGSLDVSGLPEGLSAELVYGARAIYLRVWSEATQAAKGTIKLWPYGDSITEGYNMGSTKANYRVLLAQKLSLLGFNVEMVGCYDKINQQDGIDPAGQAIPDAWKWHSAKHGGTAGPTSATGRNNQLENVDTLCPQAGSPDAVLLHIGVNDLAASGQTPALTFNSWTNVIWRLVNNLPNSKIVATTLLYGNVAYQARANQAPNITTFNGLVRTFMADMPSEWVGHVIFLDMNTKVGSYADKAADDGIIYNSGSDWLHPDWWGHDQMAEGWLSVITNQFTSTQDFPSAIVPDPPAADELGAAAKSELSEYRKGYQLCRRIDAASNLNAASPYAVVGEGAAERIGKVAYFVEYVRADNNAHKWVWVDMDAFGTTIDEVGLPAANHQQVVTRLHVKSNHNGIDDVAANDDTVSGFVEFSPYNYNGNVSGVSGAPTGNASCCDWNDTLSTSGSYGCMQVHRISPPSGRGGQVLFAYNNWQSSSSTAEFGIGNFSSHFYRGANDAQTIDYTYTAGATKMNASAYSVKRIEIWTKEQATDTDFPTPYSWIDMYFPELVSGWSSAQYNEFATNTNHASVKNGYAPWESYVLGLDPTNEMSKFLATIRMEGTTPIVGYSPTNEALKASGEIEYVLQGKPTLTNGWQDVEFNEPGDTNRFFRVRVTW